MNKTLVGLVAAAGMLGCAKDVPVYSPRPVVVEEAPGVGTVYTAVWSDAEQLKLSVYAELVDGTRPLDMSWSTYAPKDSLECLREGILFDARVDAPEFGLAGWVNMNASDDLCNGSVEACRATYTPDNGPAQDITANMCADADGAFASMKETLDTQFFNIHTELNAWYDRKGF
ncbi:MAG: hypothetical protein WC852_02250 [Candidatus Nanoarchaeia archaeon]|jgi:hypothetical protein